MKEKLGIKEHESKRRLWEAHIIASVLMPDPRL
jgi:hypothetical protein